MLCILLAAPAIAVAAPPDEATTKNAAKKFLTAVGDKKPNAIRGLVAFPFWMNLNHIPNGCDKGVLAKTDKGWTLALKCLTESPVLESAIADTPSPTMKYAASVAALPDESFLKPLRKRLADAKDHGFVVFKIGDTDRGEFSMVIAVDPDGKVRIMAGTMDMLGD
jgi:hypothetical protein